MRSLLHQHALGKHILVELYGCSPTCLQDVEYIEHSMIEATQACGATLVNSVFHHFAAYGVSGVVVIQESHLTIHTWPEHYYAAADLFTCGNAIDPWMAFEVLKQALQAQHSSVLEINRGQGNYFTSPSVNPPNSGAPQAIAHLVTPRRPWFPSPDQRMTLALQDQGDRLFKATTAYQTIAVFETPQYGKMLVLDQRLICTETGASAYHEMLVHVPMFTHPLARRILVLGGGDGGVIRELLKHPTLDTITVVEIDAIVLQAVREFLPDLAAGLEDPKVDVVIAAAEDYLKTGRDSAYDLIIVDAGDPMGWTHGLYTAQFYRQVYRCLQPDGLMVTPSASPQFQAEIFQTIDQDLGSVFGPGHVHCYLMLMPTDPTGLRSFAYGTKKHRHPATDFDAPHVQTFNQRYPLQYYNAQVHTAAFSLPNFVAEMLALQSPS